MKASWLKKMKGNLTSRERKDYAKKLDDPLALHRGVSLFGGSLTGKSVHSPPPPLTDELRELIERQKWQEQMSEEVRRRILYGISGTNNPTVEEVELDSTKKVVKNEIEALKRIFS